ncbi:MAG: energy-coupling factor transporter transmembrane protein EcfT [Treponema sp.]|nr:energy-coupling factor transporter transmembrane protein EcfT [Treponema sp.]
MVEVQSIFKYKTVKGPLHKIPAFFKLVLFLPLSIFCAYLPPLWLSAGIAIVIIFAFLCGITAKEQLTDFKPTLLYTALMFFLSVFSNLYDNRNNISLDFIITNSLMPNTVFLQTVLRLTLIVQLSALLFRTTSSLEIREVVRLDILSLFLCFIPEIFKTWTSVNFAWKARGGKRGFVKLQTLLFVLISLSFEKAAVKAKALEARRIKC